MYGLRHSDIDALAHLRGAEIAQICLGTSDIQFNFHPQGNISVWGRCELLDSAGEVIDVWNGTRPGIFRFPELLMSQVSEISIESSRSLILTFENGQALRVVDDSDQYESFSVGELIV
jgi:hypothetical protein